MIEAAKPAAPVASVLERMEETAARVERRKSDAKASGDSVVPRRRSSDWAKDADESAHAKTSESKTDDAPVAAGGGRT